MLSLLFLVDGQEAQDHAIRIPEGPEGDGWVSWGLEAPSRAAGSLQSREQSGVWMACKQTLGWGRRRSVQRPGVGGGKSGT